MIETAEQGSLARCNEAQLELAHKLSTWPCFDEYGDRLSQCRARNVSWIGAADA